MNEVWVGLVGVLAVLVAGEALVLLVATSLVPTARPWRSPKNLALAAADLGCGAALLLWVLRDSDGPMAGWPLAVILAVAVLQGFRAWEHLAGRERAFAANRPLVVLNALKLALALGALAWVAFRVIG